MNNTKSVPESKQVLMKILKGHDSCLHLKIFTINPTTFVYLHCAVLAYKAFGHVSSLKRLPSFYTWIDSLSAVTKENEG